MISAQEPGGPALELSRIDPRQTPHPGSERVRRRGHAHRPQASGKLEPLPDETMVVAGKSLKCRHFKIVGPDQTAEVWLNEDVGPFGLVKLKSGAGGGRPPRLRQGRQAHAERARSRRWPYRERWHS